MILKEQIEMKRVNLILVVLIAMVLVPTSSYSNEKTSPKQIGIQVLNILKSFDATNKKGFDKNFPTIQELRKMGETDKLTSNIKARNDITSYPRDVWLDQLSDSFNDIKKVGSKNNINWKNIKFSDFLYKVIYEDGIKYIEGQLAIKHSGKEFKFETYSIWDGKKYILLQISDYY